jgi:hypothetical protein
MKRGARLACGVAMLAAAIAGPGAARSQDAPAVSPPPDYAHDGAWLCRPARADACRANLDTTVIEPAGASHVEPFRPAASPPIDCFYVYPTISRDPGLYSDLSPGPDEEAASARSQFARFASRCRVFAPVYRQFTLTSLFAAQRPGAAARVADWSIPYADVRAAWREYLRRDNAGRGFVLVGHSQGAILLTRLIAEEIDGKPAQKLLVSALLAGHPGLAVPAGRDVGGAFKSVPLCRAAGQTGCAVVWSSYQETDATPRRYFGRAAGDGMAAACVNPAAPAGGRGALKTFMHLPEPTGGPPPYREYIGQASAECVSDADGSVLRVHIEPGVGAEALRSLFASRTMLPTWGLHSLDMSLVLGNLLDDLDAQTRSWSARL